MEMRRLKEIKEAMEVQEEERDPYGKSGRRAAAFQG
jgi:hypothetical protein